MSLARATLISTAIAALSVSSNAQVAAGGPYAPVVLFVPSNARTLALGNTGVASRDDPLFFNPAMLVLARGTAISAERFSASSSSGAMSNFTVFGTGAIGIGARFVDYEAPLGAFPSSRVTLLNDGPAGGTSFEAVAGIGQVIKGIRVGAAAKYAQESATNRRAGRAAFDLGVSKDFLRIYTFGVSVQNIGESMSVPSQFDVMLCTTGVPTCQQDTTLNVRKTAYLPLRTTFGASAARSVGELDLSATAAVSMLRTNFFIPSGGAEASYSWLEGYAVALRVGGRRPLPGEGGLTAGAGFTRDRVSVDYALETLLGSRVGHRIGLRIR